MSEIPDPYSLIRAALIILTLAVALVVVWRLERRK